MAKFRLPPSPRRCLLRLNAHQRRACPRERSAKAGAGKWVGLVVSLAVAGRAFFLSRPGAAGCIVCYRRACDYAAARFHRRRPSHQSPHRPLRPPSPSGAASAGTAPASAEAALQACGSAVGAPRLLPPCRSRAPPTAPTTRPQQQGLRRPGNRRTGTRRGPRFDKDAASTARRGSGKGGKRMRHRDGPRHRRSLLRSWNSGRATNALSRDSAGSALGGTSCISGGAHVLASAANPFVCRDRVIRDVSTLSLVALAASALVVVAVLVLLGRTR